MMRSWSGALGLALVALVVVASCKDREQRSKTVLAPSDAAAMSSMMDGGGGRAPGCGKTPPAEVGALLATAAGRTFRVYPPRGYDASKPYPVLFVYHGINTSGGQFQSWFKMEEHVMDEAIVVYPDARKTSFGAAWDLGGDRDVTAFDDIRGALFESYCADLGRLYAMGFSYGGKFVTSLACQRASVLRAVSSNDASWGRNGEAGCSALPVLVTHRTNDPDEIIAWGKASAESWARIDGCQGPTATDVTDAAHGCFDYRGCKAKVTFCEDTYVNASWPKDWNHTVREEYRDLVWRWLRER